MKFSVDEQEVFSLSPTQKQVIANDIPSDVLDEDIKRRVQYIVMHKYERCLERLKKEWEPKLKERGVAMIPTDDEAFAQLIFSQPDYKNRSQRELDK